MRHAPGAPPPAAPRRCHTPCCRPPLIPLRQVELGWEYEVVNGTGRVQVCASACRPAGCSRAARPPAGAGLDQRPQLFVQAHLPGRLHPAVHPPTAGCTFLLMAVRPNQGPEHQLHLPRWHPSLPPALRHCEPPHLHAPAVAGCSAACAAAAARVNAAAAPVALLLDAIMRVAGWGRAASMQSVPTLPSFPAAGPALRQRLQLLVGCM